MVTIKNRTLHVLMNGILIGELEKTTKGALSFTYHQTWLDTAGARPISLSLPLTNQSFEGDNVHYHWHNIQRSHFLETAKTAHYSVEKAEAILDEMLQKIDSVIEEVSHKLPKKFPSKISQPIFDGMKLMQKRLKK